MVRSLSWRTLVKNQYEIDQIFRIFRNKQTKNKHDWAGNLKRGLVHPVMLSRFIPQHTELSPLPATQQSSKRIANESSRPTMKDETQSKQVLMLALGLITTGMGLAM